MKGKIQMKAFRSQRAVVLLGLAGVVFAAVAMYQVVFTKPNYIYIKVKGSPGNWWWVTPRPPDFLAFSVKKGDKEYNAVNRPTAEVMSVDVYDSGGSTRDVYMIVKLEARYNPKTNQFRYKGEQVEIGGPISFSLGGIFFPGMVVANYGSILPHRTYVEKTIRVRHRNRLPYEYSAIVIGDKIFDGDGVVISEIVDKSRAPAVDTDAYVGSGQLNTLMFTNNSIREDFYITLKMKFQERNDEFIYREEQYIKVGSHVWIMFPRYNISEAQVVSIE